MSELVKVSVYWRWFGAFWGMIDAQFSLHRTKVDVKTYILPFLTPSHPPTPLPPIPQTMVDDDDDADDDEQQEVPLPNVKSSVLSKVIDFAKHHATQPMSEIDKPLKSANMSEVVQSWYSEFVDVDQELLFELILAANYMDIKPLLDLTCATVASMIKGKRSERDSLGIR